MDTLVPLSIAETAFAARVSPKVVQHALARKSIRRLKKGREAPLPSAAAFALAVLKHAPVQVEQRDQRALFDAFLRTDDSVWLVEMKNGTVSLPRGEVQTTFRAPELFEDVARRVFLLQRLRARVECRPDILSGTPVFKGTRASVERVGALMKRSDVGRAGAIEDYPQLSPEDFEIAELYVQLNPPRRGRPPKPIRGPRFVKLERDLKQLVVRAARQADV